MKNKVNVVPAVLTDNPEALKEMLGVAQIFTDFVQIDIMDGLFVPSQSISAEDIANIKPGLKWEAHLMVNNPQSYIKDFVKAGAHQIIFHYEADVSHADLIDKIHASGIKAGVALNPDTDIALLDPIMKKLDSVLFMSVIPGFYGSKFISGVLEKIVKFRKQYPSIQTGIDGGIKETNILEVAKTGVNSICVGSAVFCQENPAESYHRLLSICNG